MNYLIGLYGLALAVIGFSFYELCRGEDEFEEVDSFSGLFDSIK